MIIRVKTQDEFSEALQKGEKIEIWLVGGGTFEVRDSSQVRAYGSSQVRACPVALVDIVVHPNGAFPEKVKARACCAPTWECDIDGKRKENPCQKP